MTPYMCPYDFKLGLKILRRKLGISNVVRQSTKRINEYREKLDLCFSNLKQYTFLSEIANSKVEAYVEVTTNNDDNLYAPCIQWLLWDQFRIHSIITRTVMPNKLILSFRDLRKEFSTDSIKSYIISNLSHKFNLYRGSIPIKVCEFIRELEATVTEFGIFKAHKGMRVYWTIDVEAQLAYFDNGRRRGTNIFCSESKYAPLLSETLQNISKKLNIPLIYFIPMELLDHKSKDVLGNTFFNIPENREVVKRLANYAPIAFHMYHHNEYSRRWATGQLTEDYVKREIVLGKAIAEEADIKLLSVSRYPGLRREPFSLDLLEQNEFRIDMSDLIDCSTLRDFSAYCRYRLLQLEGQIIRPSKVWEIPVIYSDPYVKSLNTEKIENLIRNLNAGANYHNGEVALLFHDVIIGLPENTGIIFNLNDGRAQRVASNAMVLYFASQFKELLGSFPEAGDNYTI